MTPKLFQLRKDADRLSNELVEILDEIEDAANSPIPSYSINDRQKLVADLRERRKSLSLEELEMQTELSRSTLTRMMKDPGNTSLDNFLAVANELGMKIWIEE